jgi:hypothetical protein
LFTFVTVDPKSSVFLIDTFGRQSGEHSVFDSSFFLSPRNSALGSSVVRVPPRAPCIVEIAMNRLRLLLALMTLASLLPLTGCWHRRGLCRDRDTCTERYYVPVHCDPVP